MTANARAEILKECAVKRISSYGSHPWAIIHTPTGQRVNTPPQVFDHPDLGKTVISGQSLFKRKGDAQAALDSLRGVVRATDPVKPVKYVSVQQRDGIQVGKVYPLQGRGLVRVRSIHRYGKGRWQARVTVSDGAEESVELEQLDSKNPVRPVSGYAVGPGPIRRRKLNPRPPRTVEEAHAAGRSDGAQGLGPIAPRAGPLRDAYMQSYRDALVARVGVPERRRNPRKRGKTVTTTTRATVIRRTNPKDPAAMAGAQINRELDRLDASDSKLTREFIAAGRGHEKPWDTLKMTDPMAVRLRAAFARRTALRNEIERRYGPGAPHRLPRGFGAIRAINPRKRKGGKTVTTTTRATVVRRTNRRSPPRSLVVLYAQRPGMRRLRYLGRGKFGERGRPMLFNSVAHAALAGRILKDTHPHALRGWTLTAG